MLVVINIPIIYSRTKTAPVFSSTISSNTTSTSPTTVKSTSRTIKTTPTKPATATTTVTSPKISTMTTNTTTTTITTASTTAIMTTTPGFVRPEGQYEFDLWPKGAKVQDLYFHV